MGKMVTGVRQSLAIVDQFRPDVCFATGGYVCGPVIVACSLRKVPVLIYLPDITPGYAIRWLSRLAQRVAVSFPEVAAHFGGEAPNGKAVVTGYPVRQELVAAAQDRVRSESAIGNSVAGGIRRTRLVRCCHCCSYGVAAKGRGPSTRQPGARCRRCWPRPRSCMWWATGTGRSMPPGRRPTRCPAATAHRYHPVAYLHEEMPLALAAADLTVARAGASTLGEFPVARLPAVLAPYAGVNQMDNAQALAKRGAAVIVRDEELPQRLASTVNSSFAGHAQAATDGSNAGCLGQTGCSAAHRPGDLRIGAGQLKTQL